jgi:hypothetical protein
MNWQEILTIILPLIAFMGWVYTRIDKKFEAIDKRFDGVFTELKEMRKDLQSLDTRVARIEGQLNRPPYWEPELRRKEK